MAVGTDGAGAAAGTGERAALGATENAAERGTIGAAEDAATQAPKLETKPLDPKWDGEHLPGNDQWRHINGQVRYLNDSEREIFRIDVGKDGKLYDKEGDLFDTTDANSLHSGDGGQAIFVADPEGRLYASTVHARGYFHHSSFLTGGPVSGAGEMCVVDGKLELLSDQSGHYQPPRACTQQVVDHLRSRGVGLDDHQIEFNAPK